MGMDRKPVEMSVTIADGQSVAANVLEVGPFTMFEVYVPAGTEGTHLQFLEDKSGTPKIAKNDVTLLKIVAFTADQWVDAPVACATMHRMWIKTCSDAVGTAQAQTGAATLTVRCKG